MDPFSSPTPALPIAKRLCFSLSDQGTIKSLMNMKRKILFHILMATILLAACDHEENKPEEPLFAPGKILVGIKSNVPIDLVFDLMNEKGVAIDVMYGFYTYSLLPIDSLTFINNQTIAKSYLNGRGRSNQVGKVVNNRIELNTTFFEMDLVSQLDWLETIKKSQLNDLGAIHKLVVINVTPGTEKEWLEIFETHPYVKSVSLNLIIKVGD
jgi:hypothetical protein